MKVFNDLQTRGVHDILIAVTDGLKGMPEALAAAYPETTLQTCIVHLIRNSLDYASWKDRKESVHAATLLVQGRSGREVAMMLKVSPETISRWKATPEFQAFSASCSTTQWKQPSSASLACALNRSCTYAA